MARARRGDDGRYHGDLPCRWCDALLDQNGRRRPRLYCGPWHRTKTYAANIGALIAGMF
ncbi:hypothetical protein ACPCTK_21740 [Streptomyces pseudogriseolus]|uniref:hypothetical protein n=1 Tax=Streptomyces pseudogriseolus TaxID=36817 RepID=UPI003FA2D413|nr:hypothetical protein [Streptomyces pseudogriseolus]